MRIRLVKQLIKLENNSLRISLKNMVVVTMKINNLNNLNRYQGFLKVLNLLIELLVVLREELYQINDSILSTAHRRVSLILLELVEVHKLH